MTGTDAMPDRLRIAAACLAIWTAAVAFAQDPAGAERAAGPAADAPGGSEPAAKPGPPLSDSQAAIRVRFSRFEETLLKMAGYLQKTEPARAELVLRALRRSKEERLAERMTLVSGLLTKGEAKAPSYADAIAEQGAILADLRELLTILRSEDILDENRKEQERLKELARQITALIDAERVHQADTGRGEPSDRIAQGQEKTAQKTGEVVRKIDEHDRKAGDDPDGSNKDGSNKQGGGQKEGRPGDDESSEPRNGDQPDQKPNDRSPGDKPPSERGKPSDKDSPGEQSRAPQGEQSRDGQPGSQGQPGQSGKPDQSGKPSQSGKPGQSSDPSQPGQAGQPGENPPENGDEQGQQGGEPGESSESGQSTPGRQELEAARDRMQRAIEELKGQRRGEASKAQEEAIQKLIEAKERIEELLRQLREEEREMMLRALEARFQKMLQMQQVVLDVTQELSPVATEKWQDREFARCRDAAATEREILVEADKALEVLQADGSSVAFPEAVDQIRTDVADVAGRLGREDAGRLTVAIEMEIVDALQEMILALQKEMEKLREKKGQAGRQGEPADPALVDKLAELKMLKTLQLRVNRRTKTLGQMFEGEQATEPEIVGQLRELSERQGRLQRATYDLAVGKTAN